MRRALGVHRAIARAEDILPGRARKYGTCPRWQAIIAVGEYIEEHPIPVCDFALKWARRPGIDLGRAISCCLIEHLLEHHFDLVFPRMRQAARHNPRVAEHFKNLGNSFFLFGQAIQPKNVARLKRLGYELRSSPGKTRK